MNKQKLLDQRFETYLELIKDHKDNHGFIATDHCDSLLWTGLLGCVNEINPDILQCRNSESGQWFRRPNKDCWPQNSKSTISRDMLVGLAWFCWYKKRGDIAEMIVQYAFKHWLFMGKGTGFQGFSRINIMPPLLATFALISYKLGVGPNRWWLTWIPADYDCNSKQVDYKAHLQLLHCYLRNKITKQKKYQKIFNYHAKRQPCNPVYQYMAGNRKRAKTLLTDPVLWPISRLPTRGDRKVDWILQRDYGPDWKPASDPDKQHHGGDYLWAYWLICRNN